MRNLLPLNPTRLVLARGEIASFRPKGGACWIACVTGSLWVTVSGRREDIVLLPGEEAAFTGHGRIVVEALRPATLHLEVHGAEHMKARALLTGARMPAGLLSVQEHAEQLDGGTG